MAKILTFADYHLGTRTYGSIDPETNLNTRELSMLKILDEMIDYAIDNEVEFIIAAGDMYKNNMPSPTIQNQFFKRIKRAADNDIDVLILDGNHDVGKMENSKSATAAMDTLDIKNIHHRKFFDCKCLWSNKDEKYYQFVFLPTYHTREEIEDIVENRVEYDEQTIFIGHMTIQGALLNDWLIEDKEVFINASIFDKPNVLAVVLGHLHKHQVLSYNPLVYYTGSTDRIDFTEEKQPKGFVVLDINDDRVNYEFVEVNAQKFYTGKFEFEDESDATSIIIDKLKMDSEEIENAIVRIKVNLDESTIINDKEIYEVLNELNPCSVLNLQKIYNYSENTRNSELSEGVSIQKSLELYYEGKPREKERINLGKEIINYVENNL